MRQTKTLLLVTLIAGIALGGALVWFYKVPPDASSATAAKPAASAQDAKKILYYQNPMDPKITSDKPMKDNMGMDYLPVYAGGKQKAESGIRIDPREVQNLGVRTALVEKRTFTRAIRAVGTVTMDERGISAFSPKVAGWLQSLHVKAVGDVVERGQTLAAIYSPELFSAEEEYRIAARAGQHIMTGSSDTMQAETRALAQAARTRLELLDVPAADIAALAAGRAPARTVTLRAPFRGVVTELNVREGVSVTPETRLFTLADLRRVWVNAELYADQLPWVKRGDPVELTVSFMPGRRWQGTIDYLYPTVNNASRTVTARLAIDNPDGVLRPGMYATATVAGDKQTAALAVPREAILHNGNQDSVILAVGEGHFEPVIVHVGPGNDDYVTVVDGLKEGQRIVLSGQFLLDAEASFQGATARMQGGDAEAGMATPAP